MGGGVGGGGGVHAQGCTRVGYVRMFVCSCVCALPAYI